MQIRHVLLSIQALMSTPNPDDPLANDIAEVRARALAGAGPAAPRVHLLTPSPPLPARTAGLEEGHQPGA